MHVIQLLTTGLVYVAALGVYPPLHASSDHPLWIAQQGETALRVITPTLLELTLTTGLKAGQATPPDWSYADENGKSRLPDAKVFSVRLGDKTISVKRVGFKRRAAYAPLKAYDLRVENNLYLELAEPISQGQPFEITRAPDKSWRSGLQFRGILDPHRFNAALHVNQTGYLTGRPKRAMAGYFLGSLGELDLTSALRTDNEGLKFHLLEGATSKPVFTGQLQSRLDEGFPSKSYQKVMEADFSAFDQPGEFRLFVPGLGVSFPFRIDATVAGAFARAYALGIYHQRCGVANELPFTRFTHQACHTAPAEVPNLSGRYKAANDSLEKETANFKEDPRHYAPRLRNVASSLYPFTSRKPVDVRGGHHDAGDYSKYTINSAAFIHHLVFAADAFPGVAGLDNLGLPESGDGKSDLLQEAKLEADFLAKMQDADGGFYFLVYPREREYETDVLPDKGDPQIVFPKTTSATAAASAALAQCASSPTFKKQFPEAAALYLAKAQKGWAFLTEAIKKHGFDGAYQKITHYGDEFRHDDELAWAACELFLATGEAQYRNLVSKWLKPADPATRKWGWLRLFDAYGNATRSYAFGAKTGRIKQEELNLAILEECQRELIDAAQDQLRWARQSAYGTSFPEPTKHAGSAGWYFSSDAAFDLAVASQLDFPSQNDPRVAFMDAILSNLNYEQGCNPPNVTFLTGLGWKRQREIVHQYAQNDRRVLPPTGIPLGNIQEGLMWSYVYQDRPGKLSFPSDGSQTDPFPFYDRWTDGFNLTQEFVILHQARALGYLAWLMAGTPLKDQQWKALPARIDSKKTSTGTTFSLSAGPLDLAAARIVWEAAGREPELGSVLKLAPGTPQPQWIEAEAQLPDGRRAFGVLETTAQVSSRR